MWRTFTLLTRARTRTCLLQIRRRIMRIGRFDRSTDSHGLGVGCCLDSWLEPNAPVYSMYEVSQNIP
jgi:hypothetical protein